VEDDGERENKLVGGGSRGGTVWAVQQCEMPLTGCSQPCHG